jgi:predicted nucleic acid-binding protein
VPPIKAWLISRLQPVCRFKLFSLPEVPAKIFGLERGRLRAARKIIGGFNLLIAATALHHARTLLT